MGSLRQRLLVSATILLIIFFGVLGLVLTKEFEETVVASAKDSLRNQILLLMADIELSDGRVEMPASVAEPRLAQADSTLYAQVRQQNVVWRSDSLLDETLIELPSQQGEFLFTELANQQNPKWHMTFGVAWETDRGDIPFTVQVAELAQPYIKRVNRYQRALWLWLSALGGALILLLWTVLAWALNPLAKVSKQVNEIEQGQRQRFDEDFPREVSQLTQNLNQLLSFEESRIERHKDVLGNLAHSLKTPIAVLSGLEYSAKNQANVSPQLDNMRNIIEYQLQSASAVGRRRFAKPISVYGPTKQIVTSLSKLYQDKNLDIRLDAPSDIQFFGDQGDWMELVGNLLDNACKWAESKVRLALVRVATQEPQSHRSGIQITIGDDGPGIDPNVQKDILERGVRLDSQTPGHGIGLHIVKGIVDAYDGEIQISDASTSNKALLASHSGTLFIITLR